MPSEPLSAPDSRRAVCAGGEISDTAVPGRLRTDRSFSSPCCGPDRSPASCGRFSGPARAHPRVCLPDGLRRGHVRGPSARPTECPSRCHTTVGHDAVVRDDQQQLFMPSIEIALHGSHAIAQEAGACGCHAVTELKNKTAHRQPPVLDWHAPFFRRRLYRQINNFPH